jgi:hypothetical protein
MLLLPPSGDSFACTSHSTKLSSPKAINSVPQNAISVGLLNYLGFDDFKNRPCDDRDEWNAHIQHFPLLTYAASYIMSRNWKLKLAEGRVRSDLEDMAFNLLYNKGSAQSLA